MSTTPAQEKKNIVIVGGGIIGSTTAYFLTRHPAYNPAKHAITLLEATGIASGSSGKAGGLLALWAYPSCLVPLSFRLHAELSAEHGGERRWGYRRIGTGQLSLKGRVIETSQRRRGHEDGNPKPSLHEQTDASRVSLQKRSKQSLQTLQRAGLPDDLDWFADECVRDYDAMGSPEDTAQVHPYQFTTAMAELAQEKSAKVILGRVLKVNTDPFSSTVESVSYLDNASGEEKTLPATDVIISAGPWTKRIWPVAPISALRAHSVTIHPSRPISPYAVFTSISLPRNFRGPAVKSPPQHVSPEIYARPNNEAYACGEGDHLVALPETTADVQTDLSRCQDIIDHVSSVSEELRDGEVLVRQACYLPQVEGGGGGGRGQPLVGPTGTKGVWMAAGHTCWGIQNGPGTGKLMAEFVFEGKAVSARVGALDPRRVL